MPVAFQLSSFIPTLSIMMILYDEGNDWFLAYIGGISDGGVNLCKSGADGLRCTLGYRGRAGVSSSQTEGGGDTVGRAENFRSETDRAGT